MNEPEEHGGRSRPEARNAPRTEVRDASRADGRREDAAREDGRAARASGARRERRKRIALIAGGAAVLLVLLLVWLLRDGVAVEAARVERGPLRTVVRDDGQARVRERYVVSAPVTGELQRIPFEEGDFVSAGAVVARIAPSPLEPRERETAVARLEVARAEQEEARAAVAQAEAALAQAEREAARAERLAPAGALAEQEREQARLEAATRRAELEAARARAEAAAERVREARAALIGADVGAVVGATVPVSAPTGGQVLTLMEESERVVTAGTELLELGDVSSLEIVVGVLSEEAVEVEPGDPMYVMDWDTRVLPARVKRVEPAAYEEVSALGVEEERVDVVGELLAPSGPLGHAYSVEAAIVVWQDDDVLKAPQSALFRRGGAWAAFAVEDGRADLRRVVTGHRGEREVEVLRGLEPGELVVLYPDEEIEDGTRVDPVE